MEGMGEPRRNCQSGAQNTSIFVYSPPPPHCFNHIKGNMIPHSVFWPPVVAENH